MLFLKLSLLGTRNGQVPDAVTQNHTHVGEQGALPPALCLPGHTGALPGADGGLVTNSLPATMYQVTCLSDLV